MIVEPDHRCSDVCFGHCLRIASRDPRTGERARHSQRKCRRDDEGVLAGWRWVYFEDPDVYPLELVEVAYYNDEERRAGIAEYLASRA